MTNLTNQIEVADDSILGSVLASMPTAADLIQAVTALAIGALLTLSLTMML